MNAHEQLESRTVTVPDLNISLSAPRLICSVFEAVQHVTWPKKVRAQDSDTTPDAILQSVLTYCYAIGILASDEIETAAVHDPVIRYLSANYRPKWEAIREFRRRNVKELKESLAVTFKLVTAIPASDSAYSFGLFDRFFPNQTFCNLAGQRLSRAVEADSHALDF
jgi:hypothetical protein